MVRIHWEWQEAAMSNPVRKLASILSLALLGWAAIATSTAGEADPPPVLAQELEKVRASGKVITALWTARPDSYTLQLVLPLVSPSGVAPQASRISTGQPPKPAQPPTIQVWLLKADGTALVPASARIPSREARLGNCLRCTSYEISYTFARATGREAVAAAVRINDDFYVEALKPLRGD
jgi:hypothetical protein